MVTPPPFQHSSVPPKRKIPVWGWALIGIFGIGTIGSIVSPPKAMPKTAEEVAQEKAQAKEDAAQKAKEAAEAQKVAAAEKQLKAQEAKRGPKPKPSEWDGITPEVNAYLKKALKDYDSLKIVDCSPVVAYRDEAWAQRVRYRAKNSFGAYDLANQIFVIRDGAVIDVADH